MSKEIYILKSHVHFGSLKTSVPKGTKITVDRENGKVEINGIEHDNLSDINLGIRAGYVIPFVEGETVVDSTIRISPKAQEKNDKKMDVVPSDMDVMPKEIDISNTKKEVREASRKEKMTVVREQQDDITERGMKVVSTDAAVKKADTDKEILQVVNGDDFQTIAKIAPKAEKKASFGLATTADASDVSDVINGQEGTVVAKIDKGKADTKSVGSGKALVAKRASKDASDKAKATADARKKAIAARKAKETK